MTNETVLFLFLDPDLFLKSARLQRLPSSASDLASNDLASLHETTKDPFSEGCACQRDGLTVIITACLTFATGVTVALIMQIYFGDPQVGLCQKNPGNYERRNITTFFLISFSDSFCSRSSTKAPWRRMRLGVRLSALRSWGNRGPAWTLPSLLLSAWESSTLTLLVSEGERTKRDIREGYSAGLGMFPKSKSPLCIVFQWWRDVGAQHS